MVRPSDACIWLLCLNALCTVLLLFPVQTSKYLQSDDFQPVLLGTMSLVYAFANNWYRRAHATKPYYLHIWYSHSTVAMPGMRVVQPFGCALLSEFGTEQ